MKSRSLRSSSATSTVAAIAPTCLSEPPYRHHDTFTGWAPPWGGLGLDSTGRYGTAQMTGIDLIVAAPWVAFGIGLLVLCIRLLRGHGR